MTLPTKLNSATGGAPANLYASQEFLDALARSFFPSRHCRVEDFQLGERVFRLLSVEGRPLANTHPFLDMHEPLLYPSDLSCAEKLPRIEGVSHAMVSLDEFKTKPEWQLFLGAPTVQWEAFSDWDQYLELLRKRRVLAEDQRRLRRLGEMVGPLEFKVNDVSDDVLPTAFSWKSARDQQLKRKDLFALAQTRNFFRELQSYGLLQASTLRANGELLSIWLGAVYNGRWNGWVTAYQPNPSLAKYSLGRQILYPMLEHSFRAGHKEFDFSIGMEPYKLFFSTHVRAVAPLGTPTLRERLRDVAKSTLRNHPLIYESAKKLFHRSA